jgi:DHA1 family bicyclomycin/chloramphenicol resistance-like MFS transporter
MGSSVRPAGAFLMLDQQKEDTGFPHPPRSTAPVWFWSSLVWGLGAINLAVGAVCLAAWMMIGKRGGIRE